MSAGSSPGSPEIDEDRFPAEVGKASGTSAVEWHFTKCVFRAIADTVVVCNEWRCKKDEGQDWGDVVFHVGIMIA